MYPSGTPGSVEPKITSPLTKSTLRGLPSNPRFFDFLTASFSFFEMLKPALKCIDLYNFVGDETNWSP